MPGVFSGGDCRGHWGRLRAHVCGAHRHLLAVCHGLGAEGGPPWWEIGRRLGGCFLRWGGG